MRKHKLISLVLMGLLALSTSYAQTSSKKYTREQVLKMTTAEMSSLPLEELMSMMDIVGVSSIDELYELLLNKDVTSASKKTESLFESPLSTTVLSSEEITASGATSIEEALRLVPGVIVREKTNGNYDVHIRGLDNLPPKNMMLQAENTSTLVMINGRPVFNYAMGGILWESLPIALGDVERIEVVRGPSSALYGPNAVSGAINIITKTIDDETPLLAVNAQGGSLNTLIGDLALRTKISDKWSIGMSANYEHRDRTNDKLYVFREQQYYTKSEFENLTYTVGGQTYQYIDPNDDIDELFPDPGTSRDRVGVNGALAFQPTDRIHFDLTGGYQHVYSNNSTLGDNSTSISGRELATSYLDLRGDIYGLQIQTNYMFGMQDFNTGNNGFKTDMGQLNATAEYDWQVKNLNIRPGLSYLSVFYDDSNYISGSNDGFFNGKKELDVFAASLRLDYLAFDKLRLVAALRSEKYSAPDTWQPSWQLVATYNINDNNHIRAVYSRANRSPFLIELHSNFLWDRVGRPSPNYISFQGNKNMELMTSDMVELGYRTRPAKNLLIDMEVYYSHSKNFTVLAPDSTNFTLPVGMNGMVPTPVAMPVVSAYMNYQNVELEATQVGASISLDWVISKKLVAKSHFTVQKTTLDNYNAVTRDETIGMQANEIYPMDGSNGLLVAEIGRMAMSGLLPQLPNTALVSATSTLKPNTFLDDEEHKATPSYYGSIGLNYTPIEKLEFFTNGYFYGAQTFLNQYDTYEVPSKFLLNLKATYHVSKQLSLFVNARNMLNKQSREFAFLDETQALYLIGLKLNL